jgi:hypothetical protein
MPKITIHLSDNESRLKELIQGLIRRKDEGNPYYNRSESEIAKMILEPALERACKKYIPVKE